MRFIVKEQNVVFYLESLVEKAVLSAGNVVAKIVLIQIPESTVLSREGSM